MRMMPRLAALATLPLLAGCFDYSQSLNVAADGTATLVLVAEMSVELLQMDPDMAGEDFCPAPAPEDIPAGFTVTTEQTDGPEGSAICTTTATGPLDELQAVLDEQALLPGGVDGEGGILTLTNEGNGEYSYNFTFTIPDEEEAGATPEMQAQADQMEAMMLQMMADGTLTWSVTAPRIISTNGVQDGNTATFTLPLTAMLTDQGIEHQFNVRFALR